MFVDMIATESGIGFKMPWLDVHGRPRFVKLSTC